MDDELIKVDGMKGDVIEDCWVLEWFCDSLELRILENHLKKFFFLFFWLKGSHPILEVGNVGFILDNQVMSGRHKRADGHITQWYKHFFFK